MAPKEPKRLLVAVDFGTTFSSVAFAHSRKNAMPEVVQWWGDGIPGANEVPTVIQYDLNVDIGKGPYRWGPQVSREQHNGRPIHEWFKLRLYPHIQEGLSKKYPSRAPEIDDRQCKKLVIDYLKAVRLNFDSVLKRKDRSLEKLPREYIITVPAIWTDKAKDITRSCAKEAGMSEDFPVQIIKEPEAAGIHAIETQEDVELEVDDTFVICDAGGGTVDLVSYTVKSLNPTVLVEAAEGSGGLCGSSFLNRAFEVYLDRKFRAYPAFENRGYKADVMEYFEKTIKPSYAGENVTSPKEPYQVKVRGFKPDNPDSLGIKLELLTIPKPDLEPIFEEVVREVIKLVQDQITATRKRVRSVLLVGGFGQSHFLRRRLEDHLRAVGNDAQLISFDDGNLAIVRGALRSGLTRADSTGPYPRPDGRMPTRSYGFAQWVEFDRRSHDPTKKKYDPNRAKDTIEIMNWCIKQGTLVSESRPQPRIPLCYHKNKDEGPRFKSEKISVYTYEKSHDGDDLPQYKTGLDEIVILTAKLNRIPPDKLREEAGCYVADCDVETTLNSAGYLTFNLIVDGMRYEEGSVGTDFV